MVPGRGRIVKNGLESFSPLRKQKAAPFWDAAELRGTTF